MACRLFDFPSYYKNKTLDPRKATKLTIVTCAAIWCEAQQQCWRPIATFEKEHMCYLRS